MITSRESLKQYRREYYTHHADQISLASFYLGFPVTFSQLVVSPFRVDKNPTCSFYVSKGGLLLFKDWAMDEVYDLVDIIIAKTGVSEEKAIEIVKNNNSKTHTAMPLYTAKSKEVSILPRAFSEFDKDLWGGWGVSLDILTSYRVAAVKYYYINGVIRAKDSAANPIYCYPYFPISARIYRPLAKGDQEKHVSYCGRDSIFGFDQLPTKKQILIITKSPKDVMSLRGLGFSAVCSQSETTLMMPHYMEVLKSRFTYVYTLMDYDKAGKNVSTKYKNTYKISNLFFTFKEKDVSDNIKKYGKQKTKRWIQKMISRSIKESNNSSKE